MNRRTSLILSALGIALGLGFIWFTLAYTNTLLCYSHIWGSPFSLFVENDEIWGECKKYLLWPFSF